MRLHAAEALGKQGISHLEEKGNIQRITQSRSITSTLQLSLLHSHEERAQSQQRRTSTASLNLPSGGLSVTAYHLRMIAGPNLPMGQAKRFHHLFLPDEL